MDGPLIRDGVWLVSVRQLVGTWAHTELSVVFVSGWDQNSAVLGPSPLGTAVEPGPHRQGSMAFLWGSPGPAAPKVTAVTITGHRLDVLSLPSRA